MTDWRGNYDDMQTGGIPLRGLRILYYIAPNGEELWQWRLDFDDDSGKDVVHFVGSLDIVRHDLLHRVEHAEEGDE